MKKIQLPVRTAMIVLLIGLFIATASATEVCDGTRTTIGSPVTFEGVKFSTLSNTMDSALNTLTMSMSNLDGYAKTVTYMEAKCRCWEKEGSPLYPYGGDASVCWYYMSPGDENQGCLATQKTIFLGPYETKNIAVSVSQYADLVCGSLQLDFGIIKVNDKVISGTADERLVGWSITDLCVDCPANNAKYLSQSVPAQVCAGEKFTASVTMKNTGRTTWTYAEGYKLGSQNPRDNYIWGGNRKELSTLDKITPGTSKTFTGTATAPSIPGIYDFQWRMVRENVEWFGEYTPNVKINVVNCATTTTICQTTTTTCRPTTTTTLPCNGKLKVIKFNDMDGDGVRDEGEKGVEGVEFKASGTAIGTRYTNSLGEIYVEGLNAGPYTITETLPAGWTNTTPLAQSVEIECCHTKTLEYGNKKIASTTSTTKCTTSTTKASTTTTTTCQTTSTTLSNEGFLKIFKYEDSDGDGVWEQGEDGLAGFRFTVTGPVSFEAETDEYGEFFSFTPVYYYLPYGTYTITEVAQNGWTVTTGNPRTLVIDSSLIQEVQFGNRKQVSTTTTIASTTTTTTSTPTTTTTIPRIGHLKIFKFNDHNGNGVWEQGDEGLAGFHFTVTGPVSFEMVTDKMGDAHAFNIPLGEYTITETVPSGWAATTANPQTFSAVTNTDLVELKFGNKQVPASTTTTTTCAPTTTLQGCRWYYWFDNEQNEECQYDEFCGAYMYYGLRTFETLEECEDNLPSTTTSTTVASTSTSSTTTSTSTTTTQPECVSGLTIRARGDEASGIKPIMQLRINGQLKAEWNVSSNTADYHYAIDLCSGNHKVDIVFTNDCYAGSVDRNLYVYYLDVGGRIYYPTDDGVTYDRGVGSLAFDGLDVVPGQSLMDLNGALRFTVNNGGNSGNCVQEGNIGQVYLGAPSCCAGLVPISNQAEDEYGACSSVVVGSFVCSKCGNGVCGLGENECNCEIDCSNDCLLKGDYPLCGEISMMEVIEMIDKWSNDEVEMEDVLALLDAYMAQ